MDISHSVTSKRRVNRTVATAIIIALFKLDKLPKIGTKTVTATKNQAEPVMDTSQYEIFERQRDLQHVRDDMTNLPRGYLRSLERHYCMLKKQGKLVVFSKDHMVLRNQADTVEATLDNVATIVLDKLSGHKEYDDFVKQYGERFLYAWILCREDVENAKGPIDQNAGTRFKELGDLLSEQNSSVSQPDCTKFDDQNQ